MIGQQEQSINDLLIKYHDPPTGDPEFDYHYRHPHKNNTISANSENKYNLAKGSLLLHNKEPRHTKHKKSLTKLSKYVDLPQIYSSRQTEESKASKKKNHSIISAKNPYVIEIQSEQDR